MKNKIKYFMLAGVLAFAFQSATAQSSSSNEDYNKVLKLSPFEFGRSQFQVGFERYYNDKTRSIVILPSFILKRSNNEKSDGVELGLQYRMYLSQNDGGIFHHIGYYSGVYGLGLVMREEYNLLKYGPNNQNGTPYTATNKIQSVEGGVLLGIQIDITERIVLDFFAGGGVRYSNVSDQRIEQENYYSDYGVFDREYTGIKPRIGFQLGVTF
jgi:hypothetical protein